MCIIDHLVIFLRDIAHLPIYPHILLNFYHFDVTVVMQMLVFGTKHAKCVFRQVVVLEIQPRRCRRAFCGTGWFVG